MVPKGRVDPSTGVPFVRPLHQILLHQSSSEPTIKDLRRQLPGSALSKYRFGFPHLLEPPDVVLLVPTRNKPLNCAPEADSGSGDTGPPLPDQDDPYRPVPDRPRAL